MRTLIKNLDWIITVDRDRRMIRDGAIAIIDDRIEAIEKTSALARSFGADEVMDAEGRIALPGFVDCSVSNVHHLGRGPISRIGGVAKLPVGAHLPAPPKCRLKPAIGFKNDSVPTSRLSSRSLRTNG